MKKLIAIMAAAGILASLYTKPHAQSPNAITYQAVARNASGNLLQNQQITLRFTIYSGSISGGVVYRETQTATTNNLGLFTVNIGQGTAVTGTFNNIDWGGATKYTGVEMDAAGGSNYVSMGTVQMLSVPYALHATKTDTAVNVKLSTGAANGYLLQSDASGNASWASPASLSGLKYIGTSYIGANAGAGGTGTSEGTSANLSNINIGYQASNANATGGNNIALGDSALLLNQNLTGMVAIGNGALSKATTDYNASLSSSYSVAIGYHALNKVIKPANSVAIGYQSMGGDGGTDITQIVSNTAVGYQSLASTTGGPNNSAFGAKALAANAFGGDNTAVGNKALQNNTSGNQNTVIGSAAGTSNITGNDNTFVGYSANTSTGGLSNATAIGYNAIVSASNSIVLGNGANVGIGTSSPTQKLEVIGTTKTDGFQLTASPASGYLLQSDASGNASWASPTSFNGGGLRYIGTSYIGAASGVGGNGASEGTGSSLYNINIGSSAGNSNTTGSHNIALGSKALYSNDTLHGIIAIGDSALYSATKATAAGLSADYTVAIGYQALTQNTWGKGTVAIGYQSQYGSSNGIANTSTGYQSLLQNDSKYNAAFGYQAMLSGTDAGFNAAFGTQALQNSDANYNSAVGLKAGATITSGANNTFLGANADASSSSLTNATAIGANTVVSADNSLVLGNGANVGIGTSSPTQKLEVIGTTKTDGLQLTAGAASGYLLQSDASGNASWASPTASIGAVRYVGNSYVGATSGPGGNGASEGTGSSLYNINIGNNAGNSNTTGNHNIAMGTGALYSNDDQLGMIAIGDSAFASAAHPTSPGLGASYSIAIGYQAAATNDWGAGVVAIGYQSQYHGNGINNTSVGYQSLYRNNASAAGNNAAFGHQAMQNGLNAFNNAAFGSQALQNSDGSNNSAFGYHAGKTISSGQENTFLGASADASSSSLTNATAVGYNAIVSADNSLVLGSGANVGIGTSAPTQKLEVVGTAKTTNFQMTSGAASGYVLQSDASGNASWVNTSASFGGLHFIGSSYVGANSGPGGNGTSEGTSTGLNSIFMGDGAGQANTSGHNNVALGYQAGQNITFGSDNISVGYQAAQAGINAFNNIVLGSQALLKDNNAIACIAIGSQSQTSSTGATGNVSVGFRSLYAPGGSENTAVGDQAGQTASGSSNTFIGSGADGGSSLTNATAIGANAVVSASNSLVLGNRANVGIGTSAPAALLSVGGASLFQVNSGGAIAAATGITSSGTIKFSGVSSGLVKSNGGTLSAATVGTDYQAPISAGTGITISSNTINTNWTASGNNIYSNNSGTVSIGTSTSEQTLTVNGGAVVDEASANDGTISTNGLHFGGGSGEGIASARNAFSTNKFGLDFYTANTKRISIANGGNVGIGTSSPNSMLEVHGGMAVGYSAQTGTGAITLDNTAAIWDFSSSASITLPAASGCTNRVYTVVNRTATVKTISNYTDLSNSPSTSIGPKTSIDVISNGTVWLQVR